MYANHHAANILILFFAAFAVSACGGARLSPVHEGKFVFEGVVKDEGGKAIANAWVKVRGWETLTDEQGHWTQMQVVDCGTLREHAIDYSESNDVLIEAPGFISGEEHFFVKHPGYFQSCEADQKVVFDTVLKLKSSQTQQARETEKVKPPEKSPEAPAPATRNSTKGGYSL